MRDVMLLRGISERSDRVAITFPDGQWTWRELRESGVALAATIAGSGRRIAVWAEPSRETVVAVVGAVLAGVAVVPIAPSIGTLEFSHLVEDSDVRVIFVSARDEPHVQRLVAGSRVDVRVVTLRKSSGADLPSSPAGASEALVLYTSGTTGRPKGVSLSYDAIARNIDGLAEVWQWTDRDVLVHGLPLFHAHGLVLGVMGALRVGSPLVHLGRFTPQAVASAIADGATLMFGVPTTYKWLVDALRHNRGLAEMIGRARLLISGSAKLPAAVKCELRELTGTSIAERYGLTETLIVCAASALRGNTGVGLPVPGVEVRLVDELGVPLAAHLSAEESFGEIEVRSPSMFAGYLNNLQATRGAFNGDWFRTGDTAQRDTEGNYHIIGRTTFDVIKTGGLKVGACEVEEALSTHPDVWEVAVAGEPDSHLGQRISAWVVPQPGCSPTAAALKTFVAHLLSSYKRPTAIYVVDELPRNALGKIEKARLLTSARR